MTSKETMRAIAVSSYGPNLQFITVPKPSSPTGHDILVRIRACSITPVDTKVRAGTYDDYPDYYTRVPSPPRTSSVSTLLALSKPLVLM
jgi:NADPH:quinone reductase-like Zn-dependent oxidoreductase